MPFNGSNWTRHTHVVPATCALSPCRECSVSPGVRGRRLTVPRCGGAEAETGGSRAPLDADPVAVADAGDLVEDRRGDGERLGGRYLCEVGGDVVGRRRGAELCCPSIGEAHEHSSEATGARRVVVV